jgi:phosphate transport system permease protein
MTAVIERGSPEGARRADAPRRVVAALSPADRAFRWAARGGGALVLIIMLLVGGFLLYRGWQELRVAGWSFITTETWDPGAGTFGIAAVLTGTVLIALVAICIAVPVAIGAALYISEYAPAKLQRGLINLVDLMAAVPSIVYGMWGLYLLQPRLMVSGQYGEGLPRWLSTWFGWIPIFKVDGVDPRDPLATATAYTSSTFIAGTVVALMVAPIICAVMREVFSQAPAGEREGAYALGATKWGMIRSVVLPFGKGGMIGATMLGLGRALGETIVVAMIISPVFVFQPHILENGGHSVAALILLNYSEITPIGLSALFAAGLALFVLTLVVNFVASAIITRTRSGAASEV